MVKSALRYTLLLILFTASFCERVAAQSISYSRMTSENGLPSDRVYGMITDRLGYLWICTDKGIVKYNGYTYKQFDVSNGLVSDDVWEMLEDGKGRIWLASFADNMGYIYNDQYHTAKFDTGIVSVFPIDIKNYGAGVVFATPSYKPGEKHVKLCFTENDTIHCAEIDKAAFMNSSLPSDISFYGSIGNWDELGRFFYYIYGKYIHKVRLIKKNGAAAIEYLKRIPLQDTSMRMYANATTSLLGNKLVTNFGTNKVATTNVINGKIRFLWIDSTGKRSVKYFHIEKKPESGNLANVVCQDKILTCSFANDTINHIETISIDSILAADVRPENITTIHRIGGWELFGTTTSGAWKLTDDKLNVKVLNKDIAGFDVVGSYNDSLLFLYNKSKNVFAVSDTSLKLRFFPYSSNLDVRKVIHLSHDTFLLLGSSVYNFCAKSGAIIRSNNMVGGVYDGLVDENGRVRAATRAGYGELPTNTNKSISVIDGNRFNGCVRDAVNQLTYVYNRVKIFAEDSLGQIVVLKNGEKLCGESVGEVLNMAVDPDYGNVFLLARDRVFLFDPIHKTCTTIFDNVVFKDVSGFFVYRGVLCVAQKYGILFSKVIGRGKLGQPAISISPYKYKACLSVFGAKGSIFFVQPHQISSIKLPSDLELKELSEVDEPVRLVIGYSDTTILFKAGDTLMLDQSNGRIALDIIRQNGIGRLKFYAGFGSAYGIEELNFNEITVPGKFHPGRVYKLFVQASDGIWRSRLIEIPIYIKPYWYQTAIGKYILAIMALAVVLLILFVVVALTRRMVLRRNERRQAQTELELKSIYAQINPHFIFNTLNSALLLISKNRMDEAYSHVSKFSKLLRSYLRSSRNKFITVNEEASNLRNYIELQQARFRNKFVYDVIVEPVAEKQNISIPSLLIQPFVENAINHGLLPLSDVGKLIVSFLFDVDSNTVTCTIDDNGIGREQSKIDKVGREEVKESYGDLIINDLVKAFNKYEKMNVHVSYYDKKEPGSGTVVTIKIKNPHHES